MSNEIKNEVLSFRGNRTVWVKFMSVVKKNRVEVWKALEPLLKSYIKNKKEVKKWYIN